MLSRLAIIAMVLALGRVAVNGLMFGNFVTAAAGAVAAVAFASNWPIALSRPLRIVSFVVQILTILAMVAAVVLLVMLSDTDWDELLWAQPSNAQNRVIGLLTLPEVFGNEACERFNPQSVRLYDAPNGAELGSIEVTQYSSFAAHGGCEGLEIRVFKGREQSELPTREHSYEAPAAIALAQQGQWFRIKLADGAAWVHATSRDEFKPLTALFDQAQTAITEHFTGRLRKEPGGALIGNRFTENQSVNVLEVREVGGAQWLNVEVLDYSPCTVPVGKEPQVVARGWMPAHADSGEPTVWFSSRGC